MPFSNPIELLRIRLWLGKKIYGDLGWTSVRVSPWRLIKGPCHPGELEALRYVAENTTIPLPKLHRVHEHRDGLFLELEYVKGTTLEYAWAQKILTAEQKVAVMHQLGQFVRLLRELQPPRDGVVGSALLRQFHDGRIGSGTYQQFESHDIFHSFLRGHLLLECCTDTFGIEVTNCHSRKYRSKFTHADLIPRNVIIRDGKIVALIDWECAGFYPEYWEYTKANFTPRDFPDYYVLLRSVMDCYEEELTAERSLWRGYGEPANNYPVTDGPLQWFNFLSD